MPHHEVQKRPRMAWLLLIVAVASLTACGNGSYRAKMPPMVFSAFFGGIISRVRNDLPDIPDPDVPGLSTVQEPDHNDPAQTIKSVEEAKGMVWIFPARESTQEMRVHLICHPQNIDSATYFDVIVEVKDPYTVTIDGQPFEVTQKSASKLLFAAFGQMVQRINDESDEDAGKSSKNEGEPVVAALRQLVPWAKAREPEPRKAGLPRNPWAKK